MLGMKLRLKMLGMNLRAENLQDLPGFCSL